MKVRFWKQHSLETCGVACLLMALDAFGVDFPTLAKERAYYARLRSRCMPGTSGAAIAFAASRAGLTVTLAHGSPSLLDNRDYYYPPDIHAALLAEHQQYITRAGESLHLRIGQPITADWLRAELAAGHLVMVEVLIPGDADGLHDHVLHGLLLYGAEGRDFLLCDPLSGRIRLPEAELLRLMDTPTGGMAVSFGPKG